MDNRDILLQVCVRADIDSLYKLSSSPEMWERIRPLISTQLFWYLRVQHLVGDRDLMFRDREPNVSQTFGRELAWKTAYYDLEHCFLQPRPLQTSVLISSSVLSVRVLLELGFNPLENGREAIITAVISDQADILGVLLTHPKIDEETFKVLDSLLVYKKNRLSLNMMNTLLAERRYAASLTEERKRQLYELLYNKRTTVVGAVRAGHTEIVRLLLEYGRMNYEEVDYLLQLSLGEQSVEMLRLFYVNGRLNVLANGVMNSAMYCGNLAIVQELLPNYKPLSLLMGIYGLHDVQHRTDVLGLLLADKRLNIQRLTYTPSLVDALEPLISRRLISTYLVSAKPLGCGTRSFYVLFLRTIIIKRLSPSAALDWLIEQRDVTVSLAARSLQTGEVNGKFQEAFRGYFLCIARGLDESEMSQTLKEEGRSREGIKLAERLVAAHIECELTCTEMYRRAFKATFGSYS